MPQTASKPSAWRMPAEWEPHRATWLGWPHNKRDWPGKIGPVHWVYGEIVRKLAPGEMAHILVNDAAHEDKAWGVLARWGVDVTRVRFFRQPTDRGWTRDFGPIFTVPAAAPGKRAAAPVEAEHASEAGGRACDHTLGAEPTPQTLAVANFQFNAWAKYRDWQKDNAVAEAMARELHCALRPVEASGRPVTLEGGSIDVNGLGSLLTTEECLLDDVTQVRNLGFGKADYETALRDGLGVTHVIWLGRGIAGDDTHGHVDDLARFVNAKTIVIAQEQNEADPNHAPLRENWERLQDARLQNGSRPEVIALPMPAPLVFDGMRLPASYANFYIGNAVVLMPTFNDPNDRLALGILSELFPDRAVIGIHAVDLVWGLGTLHCLTQQQPAIGLTTASPGR